jgi:hypothetical protein
MDFVNEGEFACHAKLNPTILVADKCRDIQGYWSKGTLTVYKGYTAYQGYVAYLYG